MGDQRFWMTMRLQAMPALVSIAAIAVSVAAIVFIVDTIRGEDEPPSLAGSLDRELGELAERFGIEDLSELDLGGLEGFLPSELVEAFSGGPVLGVSVEESGDGVVVAEVEPGSPAEDAGIEPGDLILRVDGARVETVAELRGALEAVEPGADYRVVTQRDGRSETLELQRPELGLASLADLLMLMLVTPVDVERGGEVPPVPARPAVPALPPGGLGGPPMLGVQTVEADGGVHVTAVIPGLGADEAGIEPGDRIVAVDGERIVSTAQLRELLAQAEPGEVVRVEIDRDGNREQVRVALSPRVPNAQGEFRFATPDGERRFEFGPGSGEELRELLQDLPPELRFRLQQLLQQLLEEGASPARPLPQPSGGGV
jgi:S1-C subfamily serine protease